MEAGKANFKQLLRVVLPITSDGGVIQFVFRGWGPRRMTRFLEDLAVTKIQFVFRGYPADARWEKDDLDCLGANKPHLKHKLEELSGQVTSSRATLLHIKRCTKMLSIVPVAS